MFWGCTYRCIWQLNLVLQLRFNTALSSHRKMEPSLIHQLHIFQIWRRFPASHTLTWASLRNYESTACPTLKCGTLKWARTFTPILQNCLLQVYRPFCSPRKTYLPIMHYSEGGKNYSQMQQHFHPLVVTLPLPKERVLCHLKVGEPVPSFKVQKNYWRML